MDVWYGLKATFIGIGLFNVGVSLIVVLRFALHVYYKDRPGLLPIHVATVALSYNIFVLFAVTLLSDSEPDSNARWITYSFAVTLGFIAMIVVGLQNNESGTKKRVEESDE